MAQHDKYISPFSTRYASDEMQYIFSDDNKFLLKEEKCIMQSCINHPCRNPLN